jgi:hypothetical protein
MPATSGTITASTANSAVTFHLPRCDLDFRAPATLCKRTSQPAFGFFDGGGDGFGDMSGYRAARRMKPERFHRQCKLMSTREGGKAATLYSNPRADVNPPLNCGLGKQSAL